MPAFSLVDLLANKYVRSVLFLLVAFLIGAGMSAWKVSTHYIAKMAMQEAVYEQKVEAAANTAKAIDIVVVTQYKTKVEKIDNRKKDIDEQIDKSMAEVDRNCILGSEFVRLWNSTSRPVPGSGQKSDGAATKRAAPTYP